MLKKILAVFAASLFSVTAALAVDYSGKTVTMWIPFKAGGGSDTWATVSYTHLTLPTNREV